MARKPQASKAFLRQKDDSRIGAGNTISDSLTVNAADFKNLPFTGVDLLKKTDDFSKANTEAQSGDREAKADLKTVRADWKTMFGETADAVSLEANGSESLILKAGMKPTSSTSRRKQQPEQPANSVAKPGKGKGNCAYR